MSNKQQKNDKSSVLSLRLSKDFREQLMAKSEHLGLSLVQTIRYLLDQDNHPAKHPPQQVDYAFLTYVLLKETIYNFVEDGQGLINLALENTKQPYDISEGSNAS